MIELVLARHGQSYGNLGRSLGPGESNLLRHVSIVSAWGDIRALRWLGRRVPVRGRHPFLSRRAPGAQQAEAGSQGRRLGSRKPY